MAAIDLCTLSDLKGWLNITTAGSDSTLGRLITSGSAAFLSQLKRNPCEASPGTFTLYQQTVTELYSGGGGNVLLLRSWPVITIQQLLIYNQYWVLSGNPQPQIIPQSTGQVMGWSFEQSDDRILKLIGYRFSPGTNNVSVTYTNGYASVNAIPMDIQQCIIEMCSKKFRQKDSAIGQDSVAMGSVESIRFAVRDFTPDVMRVINDYKDRVPR